MGSLLLLVVTIMTDMDKKKLQLVVAAMTNMDNGLFSDGNNNDIHG